MNILFNRREHFILTYFRVTLYYVVYFFLLIAICSGRMLHINVNVTVNHGIELGHTPLTSLVL
jgi:hypothetical protein